MRSLFVSDSKINVATGGGLVSYHIAKALDNPVVIDSLEGNIVHYVRADPFSRDYFYMIDLEERVTEGLDVAVSYGAPFGETMALAKAMGAKTICDVAPHNIEISREEHERLGLPFSHLHLIDKKLWKVYTRHLEECDVLVTHNHKSLGYLLSKIERLDGKAVVIPHGCEILENIAEYPSRFTVGHLGINGVDKGQRYLMEALRKTGVPYLIAGDGTEMWQGGLGRIADSSFVYDNCSVYVQPSVTEGFGIPVLEAMARGRAVIVTEETGASELVNPMENGIIVPIRDVDALVRAIKFFMENPSEVESMGKKARETAKEWTWERVREDYRKLW